MIPNYDHLYLDSKQLYKRGWTENLIYRFLRSPDRIKSKSHYLSRYNSTPINCYYLGRVEKIEKDPKFDAGFKEQRRIDSTNIQNYLDERKKTEGLIDKFLKNLTVKEKDEFFRNQSND